MESEIKLRFKQSSTLNNAVNESWFSSYLISPESTHLDLKNAYFDTDTYLLRAMRAVARVRTIDNKRYIHTLKISAGQVDGLHQRLEWNTDQTSAEFDPQMFLKSVYEPCDPIEQLESVLIPIANTKMHQIFETVFNRQIYMVRYQSCCVEVALDVGEIRAGSHIEPICEMELELIEGSLSDLIAFGQLVLDHVDCKLEHISKYGRAVNLLDREHA